MKRPHPLRHLAAPSRDDRARAAHPAGKREWGPPPLSGIVRFDATLRTAADVVSDAGRRRDRRELGPGP